MKNFLAMILGGLGSSVASITENACAIGWVDEPEMSRKMIER